MWWAPAIRKSQVGVFSCSVSSPRTIVAAGGVTDPSTQFSADAKVAERTPSPHIAIPPEVFVWLSKHLHELFALDLIESLHV